mmetsp:Transcript_286/g.795  ORF Transcript_286/g.795 Transcript_286/m.795 type:complete len:236 (+) Transcript_286:194-901(+)
MTMVTVSALVQIPALARQPTIVSIPTKPNCSTSLSAKMASSRRRSASRGWSKCRHCEASTQNSTKSKELLLLSRKRRSVDCETGRPSVRNAPRSSPRLTESLWSTSALRKALSSSSGFSETRLVRRLDAALRLACSRAQHAGFSTPQSLSTVAGSLALAITSTTALARTIVPESASTKTSAGVPRIPYRVQARPVCANGREAQSGGSVARVAAASSAVLSTVTAMIAASSMRPAL